MSSDRRLVRWATTSARVVAGSVVAGAVVVGTVAGIAAPWPTLTASPVRIEATPAASDTVPACDGPLLALGRSAEQSGVPRPGAVYQRLQRHVCRSGWWS